MPELPEVETIVRDLSPGLTRARVSQVRVHRPDLVKGDAETFERALRGQTVRSVSRRAKNIVIDLDAAVLVVNLGMTGRLLLASAEGAAPSHLGITVELRGGRRLLYRDVRRFGRLALLPPEDWQARSREMGIEPLDPDFTGERLHRLTRASRSPVKTWLMDQKNVVGVGNIYASEALHRAGINPKRAAKSLSPTRAARLAEAIRAVLHEAIEFRGTTLLDYRDVSGAEGGFKTRLQVYDRAGQPCRRCGRPLRRIVQAGRSTFYCTGCQR